jgi:hypothetical protein
MFGGKNKDLFIYYLFLKRKKNPKNPFFKNNDKI